MNSLLDARDLEVAYGSKKVLAGVSLDVGEEEVVALIGPNGAGKSTLVKALMGLVPITRGTVRLGGNDITNRRPHRNVRDGIVYSAQGPELFRTLPVRENFDLAGYTLRDREAFRRTTADVLSLFPALHRRWNVRAGVLSGGERQMLAIGMALVPRPRLLLLDEPSGGLAPVLVDRLFETIRQINRQYRCAILLVEQNVRRALQVAARVYVLRNGRITLEGRPADLEDGGALRRAFMGF